jgi:hypothetical protein
MMERWNPGILGLYCIALKNIMMHEINLSWIEKTSTEVLKSSGFGKTPLPFMFWPVRYLPTFHYSSPAFVAEATSAE